MERVFEIENDKGKKVRVVALNDIQASAYLNEGFEEVTEEANKKKK
ncbi:hypothetical protein QNH20_18325 [Neobacillus sp. WH10]|nr:hypothetical protein [Neobacillus sp. WH10]WHY76069.1 hypothetical protein QNH20_18325 [Neobacillus sp. WH10]